MDIKEEYIEQLIKKEVEKSVKKKMEEMEGKIFTKSYIDTIISKILWEFFYDRIPNLEEYLLDKIQESLNSKENIIQGINKDDLTQMVSSDLLEELKKLDASKCPLLEEYKKE